MSQVTLKRLLGVTGLRCWLCELRSSRLQARPAPALREAWTPYSGARCRLNRVGGGFPCPLRLGSEGRSLLQLGFQGLPETNPYNHLLERGCGCAPVPSVCSVQAVPSLAQGKRGTLDLIPSGVGKGPLISPKTLRLDAGPHYPLVSREAQRPD